MALQRLQCGKKFVQCLYSSVFHIPNVSVVFPFTNCAVSCVHKCLSTSCLLQSQKKFEKPGFKVTKVVTDEGVVEVKKKVFLNRITLIGPDDEMQVVTLDEANKIALRRNLKLFQISERDPKSGRAVYKLLTLAEYVAETKKQKSSNRGGSNDEKMLNINSKISSNDLQSKIKHIIKWLEKDIHVRVIISGDAQNYQPAENVFNTISEAVKDSGRIVQKILKLGEIRFSIIQPKKTKEKEVKTESSANIESTKKIIN